MSLELLKILGVILVGLFLCLLGYKYHRISMSIISFIIVLYLLNPYISNLLVTVVIGLLVGLVIFLFTKINLYITAFLFGMGFVNFSLYFIDVNVINELLFLILVLGGLVMTYISTYIFDELVVFMYSFVGSVLLSTIICNLFKADNVIQLLLLALFIIISYILQKSMYLEEA